MHDLTSDRYMVACIHEYSSIIYLVFARDHFEYSRLTRTILTHEGDLGSLSYGEARFIEEPLGCHISVGDLIKSDNNISLGHSMEYKNKKIQEDCMEKSEKCKKNTHFRSDLGFLNGGNAGI